MHVGRLGVKWAARPMKRPWGALENIFPPKQKCRKQWGPEAILAIYHRNVRWCCNMRRLNGKAGAGRTVWRQFRNSERCCCAAEGDQVRSEGMRTMQILSCELQAAKCACACGLGKTAVVPPRQTAMLNLTCMLPHYGGSAHQTTSAAPSPVKSENYQSMH